MDTIFALASAPGKAGVSVIRVSGPHALTAGVEICGSLPVARQASLRKLRSATGEVLDEALVLVFEAGKSFTGEAVVEFQVHGSLAVIAAVLKRLSQIDGLRHAEAGEFTRRAMENGVLDLTQVEALSDLIEAETEAQRKQAAEVLSGALGTLVERWRTDIIRAASLIEATIDFADEEVPVDVSDEVRELLSGVRKDVVRQLSGLEAAERVRHGFEVAIVGATNVGKSTLLNYLAGREAAITSEVAGTTRDVIEVRMDIGGLAVTLIDTAGLRETEDLVESIGVDRAKARAATADIRLHLIAAGDAPSIEVQPQDIVVAAKADQMVVENGVSGLTGEGVPQLLEKLKATLQDMTAGAGVASRLRHRLVLESGLVQIDRALELLDQGPDVYDIVSEEIRVAVRGMSSLLGYVDVEHLLDEIFSSFCVGK
ncbi:tRNA uridine-5-carboxymethylaminomethyl(34) synthesis GTPase MnmE [Tropicibacter oceani]|uniref:tRNA modification GTPase MnmE n=1 Tax=Tropicibacter oceani TaxID=3058420 RepID=A0ABY8QKP7_9RHOB|nr:tRNA uridine-5-carboxymethylaminomethyl(34) synthesis GTPase MnmE [Tropicibacter oceani]WGW04583.1 tRNA uridine-5-carboxymethylaminomethyl(34) synthesis GTPase MnmE [Tropicibacter oceani]